MTYIARFASPSARRIAYAILVKRMSTIPRKTTWPYSIASPAVSPAPKRLHDRAGEEDQGDGEDCREDKGDEQGVDCCVVSAVLVLCTDAAGDDGSHPGTEPAADPDEDHEERGDEPDCRKRIGTKTGNPDGVDDIVGGHQEHRDDHGPGQFHDGFLSDHPSGAQSPSVLSLPVGIPGVVSGESVVCIGSSLQRSAYSYGCSLRPCASGC